MMQLIKDLVDSFWSCLAWKLPERLVLQCANRMGAHASTGKFATKPYPEITFFEVCEAWNGNDAKR
jgi:hypothetical protein